MDMPRCIGFAASTLVGAAIAVSGSPAGAASASDGTKPHLIHPAPAIRLAQLADRRPGQTAPAAPDPYGLDAISVVLQGWLAAADTAYQQRFVRTLQVKPDQALIADYRPPAANRTPGAAAKPSQPSAAGISDPWQTVSRYAAEGAALSADWLEIANRNYQSVLVRRLSQPSPEIVWHMQPLAPGSKALFGMAEGGSAAKRVELAMERTAKKSPPVVAMKQAPTPPAIEPAPAPALPIETPPPAETEAPRAAPIVTPAPSRPTSVAAIDAEQQRKAAEAEAAERRAEERRRAAEENAAAVRKQAERDEAEARRRARLAKQRQAEEEARLAASRKRGEIQMARLDQKSRRLNLVVASHREIISRKPPLPALRKQLPVATSVVNLPLPARNKAKPPVVLSEAAKARLSQTPRSSLGAPSAGGPAKAETRSSRMEHGSSSCGGRAGRRIGSRGPYVVAPGDSLWSIASRYSRNPAAYAKAIHRANRRIVPGNAVIRPCQRLTLPR